MIRTDNKNSYFRIKFKFDIKNPTADVSSAITKLEEDLDIVLTRASATDECFKIYDSKDNRTLEIIFGTQTRKRLGVIKNLLIKNINLKNQDDSIALKSFNERAKHFAENDEKPILDDCSAYTKVQFYERLDLINNNANRYYSKSDISRYEGDDIEIFEDRENYHPWQLKLEELIFDKNGNFNKPDKREIIYILDEEGCSGKSTYWKYLLVNHCREIGLLAEANSGQLKSALFKMGKRKLYILDLPRTRSKEGITDLLNVLEQLKSGVIVNNLYGADQTLLLPPSQIIVSGNYIPYGGLSPDRWRVFKLKKINNSIDWEDVSKEKRQEAKREIEKKQLADAISIAKYDRSLVKGAKAYNLKKFQRLADSLTEAAD